VSLPGWEEKGWLGAEVRFWRWLLLSEVRSERGSMAIMLDPVLVKGPNCGLWL